MYSKEVKNRLAALPVWEVFNAIEGIAPSERHKKRRLQIPGTKYSYKLHRPMIFLAIGTTCVHCGVEGTYFALDEWIDGDLHFDLYGRDEEGRPVMITVDHILPRSKGGPNRVSNYQALCRPCNEAKADLRLSPGQTHLLVKAADRNGKITTVKRHIRHVKGLVDHRLVLVIETKEINGVEEPVPAVISLTPLGEALLPWARKEVQRGVRGVRRHRRRRRTNKNQSKTAAPH